MHVGGCCTTRQWPSHAFPRCPPVSPTVSPCVVLSPRFETEQRPKDGPHGTASRPLEAQQHNSTSMIGRPIDSLENLEIDTIISGCVDSSTALAVSCKFWHSTLSSFHFEFKVPAVQIFFEFKGRLPSIIFGLAVPLSHGDPLVQSFSAKPTRCAALSAARMGKGGVLGVL